jgi:hypothetical protein
MFHGTLNKTILAIASRHLAKFFLRTKADNCSMGLKMFPCAVWRELNCSALLPLIVMYTFFWHIHKSSVDLVYHVLEPYGRKTARRTGVQVTRENARRNAHDKQVRY